MPGNSKNLLLQAKLLLKNRELAETIALLQPPAAQRVGWPESAIVLAQTKHFSGQFDEAISIVREVIDDTAIDVPQRELAWEILLGALVESGQSTVAVEELNRWVDRIPGSAFAKQMLAAIEGQDPPPRASVDYVVETFDRRAELYDALAPNLEYRAPLLVQKLVHDSLADRAGELEVLDAGCGTGLSGAALRTFAKRLVGVDLSERILGQAKAKGIYDAVQKIDLVDHLRATNGEYDLIAASDCFNYFGDLSELIPLCFSSLRENGWLVFTLELGEMYGDSWQLNHHGRYTHPPGYVMEQLGECGIEGGEINAASIRKENGREVQGLFVAVEKPIAES